MLPEISNRLPRLALLTGLSEDELRVVSKYMHLRTVDVGKMVHPAGEPLAGAGILVRGRLELVTPPPRRRLALINPGDAFGLTALVTASPQVIGCRAVASSVVLTFRREDFLRLTTTGGSLGIHVLAQLLTQLASQLRRMDEVLHTLETPPVPHLSAPPSPPSSSPGEPRDPDRGPDRPSRPPRLSRETDDQLMDLIRQYSIKAGLEDLDHVRVVHTSYQRLNEFAPPIYRRR